jgi:hypothetical protein
MGLSKLCRVLRGVHSGYIHRYSDLRYSCDVIRSSMLFNSVVRTMYIKSVERHFGQSDSGAVYGSDIFCLYEYSD